MAFTLVRNILGGYDLFVNGFHIPDFSIQKDYYKMQEWESAGKLEVWEFNNSIQTSKEQQKSNEILIDAISRLLKGERNDNGSDA